MAGRFQVPPPPLRLLLVVSLFCVPTDMANVFCYTAMDDKTFSCTDFLGDNITEEDCCLNPKYCFQREINGISTLCRTVSVWSEWTDWSSCSVSCREGVQQRRRFCLGRGRCLRMESLQAKPCVEHPCCQQDGGWSSWGPWDPCSVTCGVGQQRRQRTCSQPAPSCGGQCYGPQENHQECNTKQTCPTHGSWSPWGAWGACSETCRREGSERSPIRRRGRICGSPAPSVIPPGRECAGEGEDIGHCDFLPHCPVAGNWGPWSAFSPCTVSCGLGKLLQRRRCDQPAPRHDGAPCLGPDTNQKVCNTQLPCPVDGVWTPWTRWSNCERKRTKIHCRRYGGLQRKTRRCLGTDHGGRHCHGQIINQRACYNIDGCHYGKGVWTEWGSWSLCTPSCGVDSVQLRKRTCEPDYPDYPNETGYEEKQPVFFWGVPEYECDELEGQKNEVTRSKPCHNVPECD
ncbi:properdin-like [Narcine bancroftii]|uniref:properdin-like n=1 Tax=Narcine bancroftii TaxID=1343680 RepID=UPI0038314680